MADVIVLGAGAAGLMCAIEAGKRGRTVLVLERNGNIGEKIRISGGGRCNFTNLLTTHDNYISGNPDFCRSALARFTPEDFLTIIRHNGIAYHEKKLGQLFCDESSQLILRLFEQECHDTGVSVLTGCRISEIRRGDKFGVSTDRGFFEADSLVVATGGLSIPKLGATDLGYRIARQFGLRIVPTRPGLVPIAFQSDDVHVFGRLSGLSADAVVTAARHSFREHILFTHRGLSGPAILQASSYWSPGEEIVINLSPDSDMAEFLRRNQGTDAELTTMLSEYLPKRLAGVWCERYQESKPMRTLSLRRLGELAEGLHSWRITPSGTEGYAKAEVTCGGVDTRDLSSKTMEANDVPGLFFVGEVVDVTGHLGGYNFQWAWASGFVAGQVV